MAQLWYFDDRGTATTTDDIGFFCGGTVVSPTKILTASHCVKGYDWFHHGTVITGTDQLPTQARRSARGLHGGTAARRRPPVEPPVVQRDDDRQRRGRADAGHPGEAKPLPITSATDSASYVAGTTATVYGWGRTTSTTNDISQTLKKASLPINSNSTCTTEFGSGFVAGHMVCAGTPATGPTRAPPAPATATRAVRWSSTARSSAWSPGASRTAWRRAPTASSAAPAPTRGRSTRGWTTPTSSGDDKADLFARTPAGAGVRVPVHRHRAGRAPVAR